MNIRTYIAPLTISLVGVSATSDALSFASDRLNLASHPKHISANPDSSDPHPNILLILADDLGYKDTGFTGSNFYETPNLDRLAAQGMTFSQAYAGASNCAPSRACLMTGQNTPRHGIYTVSPSDRGKAADRKLVPIMNQDSLAGRFITLAQELKAAGYVTGNFGKWHLSNDPTTQGFDVNVGGSFWGHPGSYFAPYNKPDLEAPEGEYLTDRLTREAMGFIDQYRDTTFFLYLPFYAVHTPLMAKDSLRERFKSKGGDDCQGNAVYAGMIANMDSCIGALINHLDQLVLTKNTLVIFTSDNGGLMNVSCQTPLRGGKGTYYEGGIRVPMIFRWPDHIKQGSNSTVPVVNLDFYPTLLDMIGRQPETDLLDGMSLTNILYNNEIPADRPLFWHFPIYLEANKANALAGRDPLFRTRPGTILRYGEWKLHHYYEDDGYELYNLSQDPGERNNLAETNQQQVAYLRKMMDEWLFNTHAPIPTQLNPEYQTKN